MESSCLNKAHQQHRRAEAHLRYRRFDEAIESHIKAAELLKDALSLTQNPRSLESLQLQRDYHLSQKGIILVKKEQFENYKKAIENQRIRMNLHSNCEFLDNHENQNTVLQVAIYRTMEEADSLLNLLIKKGNGGNSDSESLKSFSTTDTDERLVSLDTIDGSSNIVGTKHPKDSTVVIEELKTLNEQLHSLVYRLVTQLDASTREIDLLKDRIFQLEGEKSKASVKNNNSSSLKVATDSSGATSPYVFTPGSESSPDVHDKVIPALGPLEYPNFTLSNFVKKGLHPNVNSGS